MKPIFVLCYVDSTLAKSCARTVLESKFRIPQYKAFRYREHLEEVLKTVRSISKPFGTTLPFQDVMQEAICYPYFHSLLQSINQLHFFGSK